MDDSKQLKAVFYHFIWPVLLLGMIYLHVKKLILTGYKHA